jgi:hypothetical protein
MRRLRGYFLWRFCGSCYRSSIRRLGHPIFISKRVRISNPHLIALAVEIKSAVIANAQSLAHMLRYNLHWMTF